VPHRLVEDGIRPTAEKSPCEAFGGPAEGRRRANRSAAGTG